MSEQIDITGVDLVGLVKQVYNMSNPAGLGFLHYTEGGLTDEEAEKSINRDSPYIIDMDYVKGRCCKFTVWNRDNKLFIQDRWYDHGDGQFNELKEWIDNSILEEV